MTRGRKLALLLTAFAMPDLAAARAAEAGYSVVLAIPASADRLVVHGLLWRCAGERCVAPTGNSRPLIICQALARAAGPVASFVADGESLASEELARCNRATPAAQTAPPR